MWITPALTARWWCAAALAIARIAGGFATRRAILVQGNDAKVPASS
jgi:hypothetical protein